MGSAPEACQADPVEAPAVGLDPNPAPPRQLRQLGGAPGVVWARGGRGAREGTALLGATVGLGGALGERRSAGGRVGTRVPSRTKREGCGGSQPPGSPAQPRPQCPNARLRDRPHHPGPIESPPDPAPPRPKRPTARLATPAPCLDGRLQPSDPSSASRAICACSASWS